MRRGSARKPHPPHRLAPLCHVTRHPLARFALLARHLRKWHGDDGLAPALLSRTYMIYPSLKPFNGCDRFAIILAGGDGVRLRAFVHRLRGDSLPKQYVKIAGDRSMLEVTLRRADKLVPPERQFVVVTESHFNFPEVTEQLSKYPKIKVAAQPLNRDTGFGLLLPLAQLFRNQPRATVALFPSDHFIEDENLFHSHVEAACRLVEWQEKKVVLLGVAPDTPETDYGYILARHAWHNAFPFDAREVSGFVEKPNPMLARKLILQGGFWNTLVMVFKIKTLLEHLCAVSPLTYRGFEQICAAVARPNFSNIVRQIFAQATDLNLSKGVLEPLAARPDHPLLVLPVRGVHWSDWGSERRINNSLAHSNDKSSVSA